ncbi:MAG: glycosyltransferase family 2 protein [Patescibacteria group bacterium]|nr:glycosyltransferase family 2 protein [Patescibacteria group bacterium]
MKKSEIAIVVPAYNEAKTVGKLIKKLVYAGYKNVIVVDDGSHDQTFEVAQNCGAVALQLPINRGAGGALRTGFSEAINLGAKIVVMMDADLQHRVSDIKKLVEPIVKKKLDIVLGSRLLGEKHKMPKTRQIANITGNLTTRLLLGINVTDSQSGFRAIRAKALKKMDLKSSRWEICSEMVGEIKRLNLKFTEIPIKVVYTTYSLSKGQNFKNGLKTLARLLAIKFK